MADKDQIIQDAPPKIVVQEPSGSGESIGSIPSQRQVLDSNAAEIQSQNEPFPPMPGTSATGRSVSPSDPRPQGDKISWTVSYFSRVIFDGSLVHSLPGPHTIDIRDEDSYTKVNARIHKYVKENFAKDLASREPFLRYANCTVTGKDYKTRLPLTTKEDWRNLITTRIFRQITDEELHLDILQEFAARMNCDTTDKSKATIVRHDLYELMKRNGDRKLYIPDKDREKFMSQDAVRDGINDNSTLSRELLKREEFIQSIHTKAQILFAMWLHAGLDTTCLQKLIGNGLTDQDLPLREKHRCDIWCKQKFDNLLRDQGGFRAVRFDSLGCHQDLDHSAVVPIHYCPKHIALQYRTAYQSEHEPGKNSMSSDEDEGKGKQDARLGFGGYSEVYCVRIDPFHHNLSEVILLGFNKSARAKMYDRTRTLILR